jgi:hypothetical protein
LLHPHVGAAATPYVELVLEGVSLVLPDVSDQVVAHDSAPQAPELDGERLSDLLAICQPQEVFR